MYGKIENNKIIISKEYLEGYKPLVEEREIQGKEQEFERYEEREECIAKIYKTKGTYIADNTKERIDTLETAVMELGEIISNIEGGTEDGEVIS